MPRKSDTKEKWDIIIRAQKSWFSVNWYELWRYRDLIYLLAKRDFIVTYKQTILGPLWHIIHPIITTFVFTLVFSRIASISTDGVPAVLFYLSGIVIWNYFADCLTYSSQTFLANQSILGKVYFPRLSIPISITLSRLVKFVIQFLLLLALYFYFYLKGYENRPSVWLVVVLPFLILQVAFLGVGVGTLVSSLSTKYRDLSFLVGFGVQLWMYASPVIYPVSQVPEKYRMFLALNPMVQVITNFRYFLFGTEANANLQFISGFQLFISLSIIILFLLLGLFVFNYIEKDFIDTI